MSVIVNVLFNGKSYLVADQRMTREENGELTILDENTHKLFRLSPFAAIGFTGKYTPAMMIYTYLDQLIQKSRPVVPCVDELANTAYQFMSSADALLENNYVQCVLSGLTSSGQIASYTIKAKKDGVPCQLERHSVTKENPVSYAILSEFPGGNEEFETLLVDAINGSAGKLDLAIVNCLKDYVGRIASKSKTVNTNTDVIILS